jgi:hypothetical protein
MKQDDWMESYDQPIKDLIKQERLKLLKSLVEEVEGMMGRMRGDTTVEEDVGYENALQDVIKLLESKK